MSRDSIKRALRTFVITTLGLWIPGLLGWLNDLTAWARAEGGTPFPDAHGLAYLGVSAIVGGFLAAFNLLWNAVEDGLGAGLLRTPPTGQHVRGEGGQGAVIWILAVVAVVLLVLLFFGGLNIR